MTIALYPASFDPLTYGHIDIAERAAKLFTTLIVGVHQKPAKTLLFSALERLSLAQQALSHLGNVEVRLYNGITVYFAQQVEAEVMVRGLRTVMDFEVEKQLSSANHTLAPSIDTICLLSSQSHAFISSSLVKDIVLNGGDIDHLVPSPVAEALQARYQQIQGIKQA